MQKRLLAASCLALALCAAQSAVAAAPALSRHAPQYQAAQYDDDGGQGYMGQNDMGGEAGGDAGGDGGLAPEQDDGDQSQAAAPDADSTVSIDTAALGDDRAYQAAFKALTPQQQDVLSKLDEEGVKIVAPDVQVLDMAAKLHFCFQTGQIPAEQQKDYATAFMAFQSMAKQAQEPLLEQQSALLTQIPFMDHQLLADHAKYQSGMMVAMASQMMQTAEKKGGFQKTNCAEVKQKLAYAARNAAGNDDQGEGQEQ